MTNEWNRFIYDLWAPVYDRFTERFLMRGRRRSVELLAARPGEALLIVGVGTGADLPLLPPGVHVTGIDLSPEMLARARKKASAHLASLDLLVGDAQDPPVARASFDAILLNLILCVVPDGNASLKSALAALKPGGRAVIFDKFLQSGRPPSPIRRLLNHITTGLGTNINRTVPEILRDCPCTVLLNEPSIAGGFFRILLIQKNEPKKPI